ncbi:transglutaminaseTgpA domain-containing protein [Duganella sp. P38]|uniref:transglutaminase family protein n=1 Tax=Duganella sp. P38 TaxID=3423949 RepID=UPI003D78B776
MNATPPPASPPAPPGQPPHAPGAEGARARWALGLTRDKSDTLLLLAAALMVLAPHFLHLPPWISALACATLVWRAAITWRGRRMPPVWLLVPVALAAMAGVYVTYRTLLGRDAGVAMLVLLLTFKLLEMHARRDLFVVTFLSFFVLLTSFLYSQSMPTALWTAAALTVLLTAQQSFQYTGAVPPLRQRLLTTARLTALAAPLALLLFVAFPRIQGPLWGLPSDAAGGKTGLGDTMAPGSLAALAQSDEIAFRVRFEGGDAPPQPLLYWRSIVLGDYDGRTWTRVPRKRGLERLEVAVQTRGAPLRYAVTLEPSNTRWLALLELPGRPPHLPGHRLRDTDELEQFSTEPLTQRVRFTAQAWPEYRLQAGEQPQRMARWLALPDGYNPRTLALARQLRAAASEATDATPLAATAQARPAAGGGRAAAASPAAAPGPSAQQLSQAVLARFRGDNYRYTLEPPLAGRHAVDEFLFDSQAGFCEHYAGAYVVLMRAMGVHARVVTGYQGGERNPLDRVLTVRQSDAHAWAEIWTPAAGWQRVDPTAAVAPERVARNLASALPRPAAFGFGPLLALQDDPGSWLAQLRFGYAALNNSWNQWVLDYNPERQRSFLEELSAAVAGQRAALLALPVAAALALAAWRARRRRRADPLAALYAAFCRQQARHGYARDPAEGPRAYAERLRGMPASAAKHAAMAQFLHLYGMLRYGAGGTESRKASLATLNNLLPLCR